METGRQRAVVALYRTGNQPVPARRRSVVCALLPGCGPSQLSARVLDISVGLWPVDKLAVLSSKPNRQPDRRDAVDSGGIPVITARSAFRVLPVPRAHQCANCQLT